MYPLLKCINPEGFASALKKFHCDEFERFYVTSDVIEAPFFETKPIGEWKAPMNFPNCCNSHRTVFAKTINLIDRFPNCCKSHKKLEGAGWFDKKNYKGLPAKLLNTLSHTEYHILNRIEIDNWYKDITDYIEYCVSSFGQLPDGFGSPVGLAIYLESLNCNIKANKDLSENKKIKLSKYIEHFFEKGENDPGTDFNILLDTYSRWLKTFPFEISIFQHLKAKFKKELPLLKSEFVHNPYLGTAKAKLKTQSELIISLVSITEQILCEINALALYQKGSIDDISKLGIEMVIEERKLELKLIKEKIIDERSQYIRVIKQWFAGEVKFLVNLRPLLDPKSSEPVEMETKFDKLKTQCIKHGFMTLPKVDVLSDANKEKLLEKLSANELPYIIAMFDYLRFFEYLEKNHFPAKYKMNKEVSKWLGSDKDGRTVKANISTLLPNSTENKKRYTAHLHKETVAKDYQNLK